MDLRLLYSLSLLLLFSPVPAAAQFDFDPVSGDQANTLEYDSKPRYNRVEGVVPHLEIGIKPWSRGGPLFRLSGAYASKRSQVRGRIAVAKRFGVDERWLLEMALFQQTASNESWVIGTLENSLAGVVLREDFRDYFTRRGWSLLTNCRPGEGITLRFSLSGRHLGSLATSSNFAGSILGGDKVYRVNPGIVEGWELSSRFTLELDRRDNPYFPVTGWILRASFEHTAGDFAANGLFIQSLYYAPLAGRSRIVARAMAGVRRGSMAPQYLMKIGGLGSLRAFPDLFRQGRYFTLCNLFYYFGGGLLNALPLPRFPGRQGTSLGLFLEAGDAWSKRIDPLIDGGFSLLFVDGMLRIDFAVPLRGNRGDWRITFRLFERL